jgi:hypothetical protein
MYFGGGMGVFIGLLELFPFSDLNLLSLVFWIDVGLILLGVVLLV